MKVKGKSDENIVLQNVCPKQSTTSCSQENSNVLGEDMDRVDRRDYIMHGTFGDQSAQFNNKPADVINI